MKNYKQLQKQFGMIDGRGYKNYNEIKGIYKFDFFTLEILHVQRDPFASPSLIRILMDEVTFQNCSVSLARMIKRKEDMITFVRLDFAV